MKVKVEYDYYDDGYRAFTFVNHECYVALSDISFENAKEKLLKKIEKLSKIIIPEPEEVEI